MANTAIFKFSTSKTTDATIDLRALYRAVNSSSNEHVYWFAGDPEPAGIQANTKVRVR